MHYSTTEQMQNLDWNKCFQRVSDAGLHFPLLFWRAGWHVFVFPLSRPDHPGCLIEVHPAPQPGGLALSPRRVLSERGRGRACPPWWHGNGSGSSRPPSEHSLVKTWTRATGCSILKSNPTHSIGPKITQKCPLFAQPLGSFNKSKA